MDFFGGQEALSSRVIRELPRLFRHPIDHGREYQVEITVAPLQRTCSVIEPLYVPWKQRFKQQGAEADHLDVRRHRAFLPVSEIFDPLVDANDVVKTFSRCASTKAERFHRPRAAIGSEEQGDLLFLFLLTVFAGF